MNFQTAAILGGAAFLLSFLAGLIGGVPFFEIFVRALFWAAVGFGLSLGIETVLRRLLPDLFVVPEETEEPKAEPERRVDITLDERADVFEDADEEEASVPVPRGRPAEVAEVQAAVEVEASAGASQGPEDEEMPEIGAFLDAFKPSATEDAGEEGSAAPEYAEYAPREAERPSSREVTIDGEAQDPVILAKAIQTVMKRDGQGS